MRGSRRAEEAMETTGMLAQRLERSVAVERLEPLERAAVIGERSG